MSGPFTPTFRDGRSGADIIAGLVQDKDYGTILTFGEIAEALGVGESELVIIRGAVNRAKRRLNRDYLRHLVAVPRKGYKVIYPGEFADAAVHHRKKSDRQIKKAISVISAADERDMTEAELVRNRQIANVMRALHERQQDTDARLSRIEKLLFGPERKVIAGHVEHRDGLPELEAGEPRD